MAEVVVEEMPVEEPPAQTQAETSDEGELPGFEALYGLMWIVGVVWLVRGRRV